MLRRIGFSQFLNPLSPVGTAFHETPASFVSRTRPHISPAQPRNSSAKPTAVRRHASASRSEASTLGGAGATAHLAVGVHWLQPSKHANVSVVAYRTR